MIIESADRDIVKWAVDHAVPWYYTRESDLPQPCLKLQCGHVTAYFHRGALTRLWMQADRDFFDDMFMELTRLFNMCTRIQRGISICADVADEEGLWSRPHA